MEQTGITLNGLKYKPGLLDPEFHGATALDPRVTLRCDATKGPRRRASGIRRYTTDPITGTLTKTELDRRIYNRDW